MTRVSAVLLRPHWGRSAGRLRAGHTRL